ncbi:MAG: Gfo/Idh/MocA family protein [Chthoniobacterales bacterium]
MESTTLRIGMAGLDTTHVSAFAKLLHNASDENHVPGARITAAFPGGSEDFPISIDRVRGFTDELKDEHGVKIVDALGELQGECDAVMLESVDGRVHLDQFREVAQWGLPVFVDKPFTVDADEAREIVKIAADKNVRFTSTSALRYAEKFREVLNEDGAILGADMRGPMSLQEKCPGYFWYGIHSVEMLFTAMGVGCHEVLAVREADHDVIVGRWKDGRIGTVRGNRVENYAFAGLLHRNDRSSAFDVSTGKKPFYASLLEQIIPFFRDEKELVNPNETVEIIAFIDAANRSAENGSWVTI